MVNLEFQRAAQFSGLRKLQSESKESQERSVGKTLAEEAKAEAGFEALLALLSEGMEGWTSYH